MLRSQMAADVTQPPVDAQVLAWPGLAVPSGSRDDSASHDVPPTFSCFKSWWACNVSPRLGKGGPMGHGRICRAMGGFVDNKESLTATRRCGNLRTEGRMRSRDRRAQLPASSLSHQHKFAQSASGVAPVRTSTPCCCNARRQRFWPGWIRKGGGL
ncbi:hypothetical protein BKA81DRAFT_365113 [Phyllosticta paracitricarpa]